MYIPILELEGTREEIIAQLPDYGGEKIHVTVHTKTEATVHPTLKLLRAIAADTIAMNFAPDPHDFLHEGRSGAMYGFEEEPRNVAGCD